MPTQERYILLDALRGFALLGIAIANFPEFGLYTFMDKSHVMAMPSADVDIVVRFLECYFVDGKFYTIFSVLFGIGFAIILEHALARGVNGYHIFYRRMLLLLLMGLFHLFFIWSGDILALYALLGMLLPVFRNMSNRSLLITAIGLLILPVFIDGCVEAFNLQPSRWFQDKMWEYCGMYGITHENYASWLQQQTTYTGMLQFLVQGAFERMTEFIDGNRYFKVLGLFLIGYYIGRNRLYAKTKNMAHRLNRVVLCSLFLGIPLSVFYSWSCMENHLWGQTVHSMLYTFSVFPMGFAYIALFTILCNHFSDSVIFRLLSFPGRMALSNYICQSLWGILLFYGVGLGLGTQVGLCYILVITLAVYAIEMFFSQLWLHYLRYGLLEWIWRMLTYGKWLGIRK
ncbi:MAG: DUF418 domain-containing protein [Bacteroidaceae bacterium]|nr:DUF418 domain-containing protein [Bacteroidaceae bacterium]